MKKIAILILVTGVLAVGAYSLYRSLLPEIIADAVVSDSMPSYIPKRLQNQVEQIRKPLNEGTEAVVRKIQQSEIPLSELLDAVDNISERQANAFLDEVNAKRPSTTNEFFDLAKRHFPAGFDPEVLREPFNKHFTMEQIESALKYANINRKTNDVDFQTAKAIVKKILREKQQQLSE